MSENEGSAEPELGFKGLLVQSGVEVSSKESIEELSKKGYGINENGIQLLSFYEALFLLGKGRLEIEDDKGEMVDFQRLLHLFEDDDEDAWIKYLTYRDLRSRGYVVRKGFGLAVDFRVYDRGEYGKDTAKYLVVSVQEGKPLPLENLVKILRHCQSQKKKLILAVMNRRGEIVYYSISQLTMKE